jgi:hypothetical protein
MKNSDKSFEVELRIPMIFVKLDGKTNLIISQVASTIMTLICITCFPSLMPLFIQQCQSIK